MKRKAIFLASMMRLLQFLFIFHFAVCQTAEKKYYIRKDLISGMKADRTLTLFRIHRKNWWANSNNSMQR
ncbi:unnamed protein product [Rotaria socialis]